MKIGLAPMDGITDLAYRTICKQIFQEHQKESEELMLWTEFMSADGYVRNPVGVVKHLLKTDYEPELIAQIFGGNPDTLIGCAQSIEKNYDFGGIELNMGCPSPKIMKCAAGSGMLKDKAQTLDILKEIAGSIKTPFSLKTRVGLSDEDKDEQFKFLIEASKYVWMIGIHGRTYQQGHSGDVDWNFIYNLKKEIPNTVIIGNGGIRSYEQAYQDTGPLEGVMIAQSAIGNPRVLIDYEPTVKERFATIFRHLNLAMAQEDYFAKREETKQAKETGILDQPLLKDLEKKAQHIANNPDKYTGCYTPREFRKYLFNYISGLPHNKAVKRKIARANEYQELLDVLKKYRDDLKGHLDKHDHMQEFS